MLRKVVVAYSLFAGLAFCTQVCAAEMKYDGQSCYAGPAHLIQHADGMVAGSYDVTGMTPGTEGTPLSMISGRCVGSFTIVAGDYNETGSCEYWNAAGDKYLGNLCSEGRSYEGRRNLARCTWYREVCWDEHGRQMDAYWRVPACAEHRKYMQSRVGYIHSQVKCAGLPWNVPS